MTKEYVSTLDTSEHVEFKGVTLLQKEDGTFATPGGGYIVDRGHAVRAAKNLSKSHKGIKSPMSELVRKTVDRLNGASSDTSVMGA